MDRTATDATIQHFSEPARINAVEADRTTETDPRARDGELRTETTIKLRGELARLSELSIEELQSRWRKLFRAQAPAHLPRYLLLRIISYKIQADALGDLDRGSLRYLQQIAQSRAKQLSDPNGRKRKAPPPIPPVADGRSLKPGTVLVREHAGQLHKVVVKKEGFSWNETTYRSLSETAQAITGTKWNGPRFFGLRYKKAPVAEPKRQERAAAQ